MGGQIAWIAEHTDIPRGTVAAVLELEFDYMVSVGIIDEPRYELSYYSPTKIRGAPNVVDTDLLARDAERFLGIPTETASKVFDAESEFLQMRGLID